MVIVPFARPDASTPVKVRVPPPSIPAAVAVTVCDPSVSVSVTVSLARDVASRTTAKERLDWLVVLMNAPPAPPPFVSVTDAGLSGAMIALRLGVLSPPVQL